jgi:hypothetical protein
MNLNNTHKAKVYYEVDNNGPKSSQDDKKVTSIEAAFLAPMESKDDREAISDISIAPFKETIKGTGILGKNIIQISRYLSKKIPQDVKERFFDEYNQLARKKFDGGLTQDEERRFDYVKWQVDCIYDAEVGEDLDVLERFTGGIEIFADEISRLIQRFDTSKGHREPFKK